jgi:hypothetical protein
VLTVCNRVERSGNFYPGPALRKEAVSQGVGLFSGH